MAGIKFIVASTEAQTGKSAVVLGLSLLLKDKGLSCAYIKPVGNLPMIIGSNYVDEDAYLINEALGKPLPSTTISPVLLTNELRETALSSSDVDHIGNVKAAVEKAEEQAQVVILEGAADSHQGISLGVSVPEISEAIDAKVLLITKSVGLQATDEILAAKRDLGEKLLGVLFVSVPENHQEMLDLVVKPFLHRSGISVYGALPAKAELTSATIGELTEALSGKIISGESQSNDYIESYMVGAMGQERALRFFRRKSGKAVITGGDRADVHLAALETPTKCLILTGNLYPSQAVIAKAEEKRVPVLLAPQDTFKTVQIVESITGRIGFHQDRKVQLMKQLLDAHLDFGRLFEAIGIKV